MKKLATILKTMVICVMFSFTVVSAATFSFRLMTENVESTAYVCKMGNTAYANVKITKMNYPSATIKFRTYKYGKGYVSNYKSIRGVNSSGTIVYNSTVSKNDKVKLYGYNPSSNGGITVSTSGTWNP